MTPWTSFVNVGGLPAIVLPVHWSADGLPMGVQLIRRPGREDVLLAIGAQLERRLRSARAAPGGVDALGNDELHLLDGLEACRLGRSARRPRARR